jgi:hypothetical protein
MFLIEKNKTMKKGGRIDVSYKKKKFSMLLLFMIVTVASFALMISDAQAYKFYSDDSGEVGDGTQNCAACHGEFRKGGNYTSLAEGVQWGGTLHQVHLDNTNIGTISCDNCHGGVDTIQRGVNLSSSAVGPGGAMALACVGCHGRQADTVGNPDALSAGWGAGLRQHHNANGVGLCAGCHADADPNNFTTAGEDAMPMYYPNVLNLNTGTNLEPCNAAGEEQLDGLDIGLDNDGDNAYDTADPDCADIPVCGDGVVEGSEECDDGLDNGTTVCGCQLDCTYTPDLTPCDDGLFCNVGETCDGAGACGGGSPNTCDNGVGCTDDSCDEVNDQCVNTANDANCPDDGQFCNGDEFCDPVNDCSSTGDPCLPGFICDEGLDECIEEAGCGNNIVEPGEECDDGANNGTTTCGCQLYCTYTPALTPCDDGLFCNEGETCSGMGTCEGGAPVDCDDGVLCTDG